jgi:hypothetical protein
MNQKCGKNLTFEECQMIILQNAVKENEKFIGEKLIQTEDIKKIISILEFFLIKKKLICYGGTAINNILPKKIQFYNRDVEVSDYDFYSKNALQDAKELADIYYLEGYKDVEAKSGVHEGTFKLYVNFISIADITQLNPIIFDNLLKESITVAGIKYASPNFLRMGIYLELSRPHGDVSRWEKIFKRLELLNKVYPLNQRTCNPFFHQSLHNQKLTNSKKNTTKKTHTIKQEQKETLFNTVRNSFIEQEAVFFGSFAFSLYSHFATGKKIENLHPDFSVIVEDIERCFIILKDKLIENGFTKIIKIKHEKIGELVPENIEVKVDNNTICHIYKPIACHNYNKIFFGKYEINIATIDTIFSFYFALIYSKNINYKNKKYLERQKEKLLCMSSFLFNYQEKNKLKINGIFKRYTLTCIGKQSTIEEIRVLKNEKFKELKNKKNTKEYELLFLKYEPSLNFQNNKQSFSMHEEYVKYKIKTSKIIEDDFSNTETKTKTKTKKSPKKRKAKKKQITKKRYAWQIV